MHRELPRERGLHNQAAEGEGDKKLPSRSFHTPLPSILHFQRAAFDGQQVLEHLFRSHLLMMAAAGRLPPMSSCCWGTAVLLSPLHPSVPACFPAGGRAGGWEDVPSPGWQCHTVLCQPLQHHYPQDFSCPCTASVQPCRERPSSKLQILTPNSFPTQRIAHGSRMEPGEQIKPQAQGGGTCWGLGSPSRAPEDG